MTSFTESAHPRGQAANAGQFRTKMNDEPASELSQAPIVSCTECGAPAEYRYGNVPRGYRSPETEAAFCGAHAARVAADGGTIEDLPKPQEPGETVVWLIEGDDHEYELVEAVSEEDALDETADRFRDRYDDDDAPRDSLTVAGVFRGDVDGYSDELEFVPYGDIAENDAYGKLQDA
ncbi:MAG: hypothetical protein J0J04_08505 [Microbacterium sp.]|uniref:hypothetical protein n=1 Tax=Microbacterium sp. TaxID=51671 RepID=UPI001ACD7459|nr:hypothetical protein [Microbacterium sp.]MBN9214817.1 hypothetical protein [Microbacterium sp.]